MSSFGERLKSEREARNRSIEEIGVGTGIPLGYLEALEKNEFHSLPGRAFGKLYIRAYAQIVGFDPQPLIEQYDREQSQQRRAAAGTPPAEPGPSRRVETMIANWREAKRAGRSRAERAEGGAPEIPPRETAQEDNVEIRADMRPGVRTSEVRDAPGDVLFEGPPRQEAEPEQDGIAEPPPFRHEVTRRDGSAEAPETQPIEADRDDAAEARVDDRIEAPPDDGLETPPDDGLEVPAVAGGEAPPVVEVDARRDDQVEARCVVAAEARPEDRVEALWVVAAEAPPDDRVEAPLDDRVDARPDEWVDQPWIDQPETTSSADASTSSTSDSTTPDKQIGARSDDGVEAPWVVAAEATPHDRLEPPPDGRVEEPPDDRLEPPPDDRTEAPSTRSTNFRGSDVAEIERASPGGPAGATVAERFTGARARPRSPSTASASRWPILATLLSGALLLVAAGTYVALFRTGDNVSALSSTVPSAPGIPDRHPQQFPAVRAAPPPAPGPGGAATHDASRPPTQQDSGPATPHTSRPATARASGPSATHDARPAARAPESAAAHDARPAARAPGPAPAAGARSAARADSPPTSAHDARPTTARAPGPSSTNDLEPSAAQPSVRPSSTAAAQPGRLTVPEFGLGRRIVNRRLDGQDERFAVGEAVVFSTRVLGGRPGERVRHVWLREGRRVQSIVLQLRGADWRTYSRKTLHDTGQWAVEARDEQGRVLASATLTAVPAGSSTH